MDVGNFGVVSIREEGLVSALDVRERAANGLPRRWSDLSIVSGCF